MFKIVLTGILTCLIIIVVVLCVYIVKPIYKLIKEHKKTQKLSQEKIKKLKEHNNIDLDELARYHSYIVSKLPEDIKNDFIN